MDFSDSPFGDILGDIRNGKLDKDQKLILAKGLLPLDPELLAAALLLLTEDSDGEVIDEAKNTIFELPVNIVNNLGRNRQTSPDLIDMLARLRIGDEAVLETIVFNPIASDETITFIGKNGPAKVVEIIAGNQERMLRHPPLIQAILENPHVSSFVRMQLELYEEEQKEQKLARDQAIAEREAEMHKPIAEPVRASQPTRVGSDGKTGESVSQTSDSTKTDTKAQTAPTTSRKAAVAKEGKEEINLYDEDERFDDGSLSIAQKLSGLNVSERIKLASHGTREERMLLIRETNRLVALAALKSPKTTEEEIEQIAKLKNVIDDILREIGNNREYVQNPLIRRALIENPRTPIGVSLTLLKYLTDKEIGGVSRNRNIPEAIRAASKRLIIQKEMRKKTKKAGH